MTLTPYDITIGSDPEFAIFCDDKFQRADEVLQNVMYKCQDCTRCTVCDGCELCEYEDYVDFDDTHKIYEESYHIIDNIYNDVIHVRGIDNFFEYVYKDTLADLLADYVIEKRINLSSVFLNRLNRGNVSHILIESIDKDKIPEDILKRWFGSQPSALLSVDEKNQQILLDNLRDILIDIIYIYIDYLYGEITQTSEEPSCSYDPSQCGECERCQGSGDKLQTAEIGCDGRSAIGEIRPPYTNDPIIHFNHVNHLVNSIFESFINHGICSTSSKSPYYILAGTFHHIHSLGGHIHVGFRYVIELPSSIFTEIQYYLPTYLSYYVGILLKRIELPEDIVLRKTGKFGEFRKELYGIQWRMPASWLVSPTITKAAICLSYVVAYEFIDDIIKYNKLHTREETGRYIDIKDRSFRIVNIEYKDKLFLKPLYSSQLLMFHIVKIINDIKHMKLYDIYFNEIEPLLSMVLDDQHWNPNRNIFFNWIESNKLEPFKYAPHPL